MIEVRDLVKRYGDRNAVDHLSFTVEDGQIFGFLGPNGAGKTTTMNIMTGYLAATGGQVLVEGHDILEEPEAAKACIGYLPELPPLYPDMTVEEYLAFCAELKKIPRPEQEEQLDQVLALTHLEEMSARLIRNLSKGYRQRVGLAQAILGFPKIIILDEPTVGLDPKQVVEIRDLIRHLAKDHTVILSSHILSEIRAVCDRVLIIRKGRFVVCDTPEDLEEKLSAGGSLELTAKAAPEAAGAVLDRVAGITGRTLLGRTEDTARFAIHMERDIREALFFAFAKAGLPLLELRPWVRKTAAIVATGSEVKKGLIQDTFTPVVKDKLSAYGIETISVSYSGDGVENVAGAISQARQTGAEVILCTGGMSVDPDDNTPGGIRQSGAKIVTYGAPVLPGAMFLLGYYDDGTPVMGLPGCVMYAGATIFDLVLPWVAADVSVTKEWIVSLGEGGLCLGCQPCRWPICPFGK